MVSDRVFVFHIYIPWGKTLSLAPKSRSSIKVTVFKKVAVGGALVLHKHSLLEILWVKKYRNVSGGKHYTQ